MIVLIDIQNETLDLYTQKGCKVYPFSKLQDFVNDTIGQSVLYVTNAMETNAKQIIELVTELTHGKYVVDISVASEMNFNDMDDGILFIHSKTKGPLCIPDLNMEFSSSGDFRELDDEMINTIKDSFTIRQLIKDKKIEILNRKQMNVALQEYRKLISHKDKLWKMKEAKELDSILIKDGKAADIADKMFSEDDDEVISVDIDTSSGEKEIDYGNLTEAEWEKIRTGRLAI